jgi:hypothetical protein
MSNCKHPTTPPLAAIAGAYVTIDGSTYDGVNGFLVTTRSLNPHYQCHSSNETAIGNLKRQARVAGGQKKAAHIIGHGIEGRTYTYIGDPNHPNSSADDYIGYDNKESWSPLISDLRNYITSLTLWSCNTGADDPGATFMRLASGVLNPKPNAPEPTISVAATTGTVRCGDQRDQLVIVENAACWQIGIPNEPIIRISPPSQTIPPMDILMIGDLGQLAEATELRLRDPERSIPLTSISSVEFTPVFMPRRGGGFSLPADKSLILLRQIRLDAPTGPLRPIAAVINGYLTLTFQGERDLVSRRFLLYNFNWLRDESSPETYYGCAPGIKETLTLLSSVRR